MRGLQYFSESKAKEIDFERNELFSVSFFVFFWILLVFMIFFWFFRALLGLITDEGAPWHS